MIFAGMLSAIRHHAVPERTAEDYEERPEGWDVGE